MEKKVKDLFDDVIREDVDLMSNYDVGSEKREKIVSELGRIHEMRVEEIKAQTALQDVREKMKEIENKRKQLSLQDLEKWLNLGLQAFLAVGGWIMFSHWQYSQQKFEMTNSASTPLFRSLLSKMVPSFKK